MAHTHTHTRGPGHDHGHHDILSANKHHFDNTAQDYENIPGAKEVTSKIAKTMLEMRQFTKDMSVMDFACGTGLVSFHIAPHVKQITGVDISQSMVDIYNWKAEENPNIKGIVLELKGQEGELEGQKFDVIMCSMAYHHMDSIEDITRILVSFLKPGGSLLVAEWHHPPFKFDDDHPAAAAVKYKKGFTNEQMTKVFEGAGLSDVSFSPPFAASIAELDSTVFVVEGLKPE